VGGTDRAFRCAYRRDIGPGHRRLRRRRACGEPTPTRVRHPCRSLPRPPLRRLSLEGAARGKIVLSFPDEATATADSTVWKMAAAAVRSERMPPPESPSPHASEVAAFLAWVGQTLSGDPGHAPLRRLNRVEYNNTIRDLVGVRHRPAEDFPADDTATGSTLSATSCPSLRP